MKRTVAAVTVLALLAPSVSAFDREGFRRDIAWIAGANAADLVSTRYALAACPTCYEANSFMREDMVAKKAVGTAVVLGLLYVVRRLGKDDVATWLRWSIVAFLGAVATWNAHLGWGDSDVE